MGDSADMGRLKLARKRDPILNKRLVNIQRAGISAAAGRGDISPLRARQQMIDLGIHPTLKKPVRGKGDDWINKLVFQTGMGIPRLIGNTAAPLLNPKQAVKGVVESVKHPRRAMETAVRENPGDLFVGALLGGLAGGPKALAAQAAKSSAKRAARAPIYDPADIGVGGAHLRPTIPIKGRGPTGEPIKGWTLKRNAPVDKHGREYLTHKGKPGALDDFNTWDITSYNLVGPAKSGKGKAIHGSITFDPTRTQPRTMIGEQYVSDFARKQLGSLKPGFDLAYAAYRGGGHKSFDSVFANKKIGMFAKMSQRRGYPFFKDATDADIERMTGDTTPMGVADEPVWDPYAGELVYPRSAPPPDIYDYFDPVSGDPLPGFTRENIPAHAWNHVFPDDPKGPDKGFGGTRGSGHVFEPDASIPLGRQLTRAQQLAAALSRRSR